MSFGENQKGYTFAFATFSPFRSWWQSIKEIVVLWGAYQPWIQVRVRALKFLHYAHFTRVTRKAMDRAGFARTPRLEHGGFLFNSAYNGDAEVYFRGFSEDVATVMNELWKPTIGWVSASPYPNLEAYILRYCRRVNVHMNAYPSFSTGVRDTLTVRHEVDKLVEAAASMTDAEFAKAYEKTTQRLWGNAR